MRLTCTCRAATPHDLSADVRVFGEDRTREAFVSMDLTIGDDVINVFLPPHAYNRARDIADIWARLLDKPAAPTSERVPFTVGAAS